MYLAILVKYQKFQIVDQYLYCFVRSVHYSEDKFDSAGQNDFYTTGVVDVAIIQSLIKKNVVDDIVAEYGQIIVDECHHLSAVSFEAVARGCKAKYFLGLTATAVRKDGHQPIIFMQCGPIRYKVDAREQARLRTFDHKVIVRNTQFTLNELEGEKLSISNIYSQIISDDQRNMLIIDDILQAIKSGRSPLILTERKEHAAFFEQKLSEFCKNVIVMVGGQNAKKRAEVNLQLDNTPESEERVIIATGRYIGEGFDDKRLDTLFLTMPISWHGTLAQYAGRLHRDYANKKEVLIYDYVDNQIAMLAKMAAKRIKGYTKIGYCS